MVNDIALLGFLQSEPLHGYEIYQRFTRLPGLWEIWRIKQSRLYAMLNRLEAAGWVRSESRYQENRPTRKEFHLTTAGEKAYQAWLSQPVENAREFRLEFLVKLYFACRSGSTQKSQLIQRQANACKAWLLAERQALADLNSSQSFEQAVHDFRIGQISAMLSWLSSVEDFEFDQNYDLGLRE